MEEEKILSLEEVIELINEPIEITSETLGNLKFRRIFNDDFLFIETCLNEDMNQEIFCKQFLINQISEPKITLDDLNDLDDVEITLILKRYIEIEDLADYFDFNGSDNIYSIFKEGMECYINHVNSTIVNHQLALVNSANSLINSLNIHESLSTYLSIANEASIAAMSHTTKILETVNQINIPNIYNHVSNMINSSAILSMANTMEIVKQQMVIWQNWMSVSDTFLQLTKNISFFWEKFQQDYQIPSLEAQKCLKKYHWFISPNMDVYIIYDIVEVCNSSSRHKRKEINDILINYFLDNNCEKLDRLVNKWSFNPLFDGRIKIIKDCINIIKTNEKNINYSNFIVPTLITQIDGIQNEFMKINGLSVGRRGIYDSSGEKLKDENGNTIYKKDYFRSLTSNNEFFDFMNDLFLDVLFQDTKYGYESIHFSRHKILHGENTAYGRKDYMIRCFMILDFLSELIFMEDDKFH
ncbi:MAG: hypothetical protein IKH29_02365 [Methanobrevibacter sp.]|uniref:hypothetical protein n=1 Tax=Methanobrevibacter sp. TaxID=66852 RepID=UPI0025FF4480|nr:hypothetical protein [Methanobrevibacter sp.]MBR3112541.1 hypothetical protein [Methanobrevibacter sp.]